MRTQACGNRLHKSLEDPVRGLEEAIGPSRAGAATSSYPPLRWAAPRSCSVSSPSCTG